MGRPKEFKMPKGKILMGKAPVKRPTPVVPKKLGKTKPVQPKKAGK